MAVTDWPMSIISLVYLASLVQSWRFVLRLVKNYISSITMLFLTLLVLLRNRLVWLAASIITMTVVDVSLLFSFGGIVAGVENMIDENKLR